MKKRDARIFILQVLILPLLISSGCEKIIDIKIPDSERKIVVNGLLIPDTVIRVNLTRSLTVIEEDDFVYLPEAEISLFKGQDLIGQLVADTAGFFYLPDYKPSPGETYRISATSPGLASIEASTTIPVPVPILSVDTALLIDDFEQIGLKIKVKFNDPEGSNYYGFAVNLTYRPFDYLNMRPADSLMTRPGYLSYSDPFLEDEGLSFGGHIYFDDLLFNGLTKTIEVSLFDYAFIESDTVWVDVQLEHVEKPYFLYAASNQAYQSAHSNPFSEPVQVYTNISGGFGIFSSYSYSGFPLVISGWKRGR